MSDDEFGTILQMTFVRHLNYKIEQEGVFAHGRPKAPTVLRQAKPKPRRGRSLNIRPMPLIPLPFSFPGVNVQECNPLPKRVSLFAFADSLVC